MSDLAENVHLGDEHLLLLLRHFPVVELFPDENPAILPPTYLTNRSKTAFPDLLHPLVLLELDAGGLRAAWESRLWSSLLFHDF